MTTNDFANAIERAFARLNGMSDDELLLALDAVRDAPVAQAIRDAQEALGATCYSRGSGGIRKLTVGYTYLSVSSDEYRLAIGSAPARVTCEVCGDIYMRTEAANDSDNMALAA